jgi:hypothetical protein
VFQNILDRRLDFPKEMDEAAKDLLDKLFSICPTDRLGYSSMNELKAHPFF